MGEFIFRLPDIGEGIAEAEIVGWHIKVGDRIEEDRPMVDLMTDKATVEMTSPVAGVVAALHGSVGDRVPVGSNLVVIQTDGAVAAPRVAPPAPVRAASPQKPAPAPVMAPPPPKASTEPSAPRPQLAARRPAGGVPLASPATRKRALEHGIKLQFVPATGPGGRITQADLDDYIASGGLPTSPAPALRAKRDGVTETKIVGLRRKIAEKMQDSKRRIPHFSYVEEFDMTELNGLRTELNATRAEDQPKLTLLPFFVRALVNLLPEFPNINARYDDDAGVLHSYAGVHVGIATQTPGGLMVPNVRHAEQLSLWDTAREIGRVTAAARSGSATREELTGSTITLTSLGTLGGIAATPVINHPEVAIIGPNKLVDRPVVLNGQITIRTMMNLSSSFDHRIVDGFVAAQFIQRLKQLIERPALLFVERT